MEKWIEDHYDELAAVVARQTNGCDVEDVLHNALMRMISSPKLAETPYEYAWTWATACTRSAASHMLRSAERQGRVAFEVDNLARSQRVIKGGTGGGTQAEVKPTD